jgi:hypothetical protein
MAVQVCSDPMNIDDDRRLRQFTVVAKKRLDSSTRTGYGRATDPSGFKKFQMGSISITSLELLIAVIAVQSKSC